MLCQNGLGTKYLSERKYMGLSFVFFNTGIGLNSLPSLKCIYVYNDTA